LPQQLIGQLHIDPSTLPIFLSDATYLSFDHGSGCCVTGFHGTFSAGGGPTNGKGNQKISTYVWASWDHPEHFGRDNNLGGVTTGGDVDFLSHEISEWYGNPFIVNTTPSWFSPLAPWYGCSNQLEVGDPLIPAFFAVDGYHLQDEAFKSWFAHDIPSEGINGQYTFRDTFTEPSTLC
jgi:hypothetical protein